MPNIGEPVCKFDEGFLTKLLQNILDKNYVSEEIECYASGYDHCRFEIRKEKENQ